MVLARTEYDAAEQTARQRTSPVDGLLFFDVTGVIDAGQSEGTKIGSGRFRELFSHRLFRFDEAYHNTNRAA
jgi:hypothetical protein